MVDILFLCRKFHRTKTNETATLINQIDILKLQIVIEFIVAAK